MVDRSEGDKIVDQIIHDYRKGVEPFHTDDMKWPVEEVLGSMEFENSFELANYLTLTGALNRRRLSSTLREKSMSLWQTEQWIYDPRQVVGNDKKEELFSIFVGEESYVEDSDLGQDWNGMTLGETDFEPWWEISQLLYNEFHGSAISLIAEFQFDANTIWRDFAPDHLPVLRGAKCGPLWLRQMDRFVHPMSNLWKLPLTLDTHIEFMTNEIYNTDYSISGGEDAIRDIWDQYCENRDVTLAEVDDALWRIRETENWNKVGEDYLNNLI